MKPGITSLILSFCSLGAVSQAAPTQVVQRYAVLAGASNGGPGRTVLRYALKDARTVSQVLNELGGVPLSHQIRLEEPNRQTLLDAISSLNERIADNAGARVELFVYYSGHSDEDGLLLKDERLPYDELRRALAASTADVRIAILDSCASGAMTRRKGGVKRPPFLVDASNQVSGYAVLTSSSDTEAAQESDRIEASFFTHYLVSGLRGAADIGGDGRVTLNEAYHFAFHETLARTERTQAGAQHPAYDIQLVGMGDLVMTDLRATSATLIIDSAIDGRVFLRDKRGALVAELDKPAGRVVELGLAPGMYHVTLEQADGVVGGSVELRDGRKARLSPSGLSAVPIEATVSRGGTDYEHIPFNISLLPSLSFGGSKKKKQNLVLNLAWSKYALLQGLELGFGLSMVDDAAYGAQITMVGNYVAGPTQGAQITMGFNHTETQLLGTQISMGLNNVGGFVGAQVTMGANISGADATGLQAAMGLNVAPRMWGTQLSSGVNYAGQLSGAQLGIINVAGSVTGLQAGIINVATGRVSGAQVGLFNYATEMMGAPLGLINIVARNGTLKPTVWMSDTSLANVGIKLGSKHVYTLLAVGGWSSNSREGLASGVGLGGHADITEDFFLDFDATFYGMRERFKEADDGSFLLQVRLTPGWQIFDNVAIVGGPVLNMDFAPRDQDVPGYRPSYAKTIGGSSALSALWPGFSVGLQFL